MLVLLVKSKEEDDDDDDDNCRQGQFHVIGNGYPNESRIDHCGGGSLPTTNPLPVLLGWIDMVPIWTVVEYVTVSNNNPENQNKKRKRKCRNFWKRRSCTTLSLCVYMFCFFLGK